MRTAPSLSGEFQAVRRFFAASTLRVWRRGISWIDERPQLEGVVSWEPFFIGLLQERHAFGARALEAAFNRNRLLRRLDKVRRSERWASGQSTFGLDEVLDESRHDRDMAGYVSIGDFFGTLMHRRARKLDIEATLQQLLDCEEKVHPNDWEQEGKQYLDHPGTLGSGGLLRDAIIGELAGSPAAFTKVLRPLLNQHSDGVTISIAFREGRMTVLPTSSIAGVQLGRMANSLSAVEARYINQIRLIESSVINEFEELINRAKIREVEIHAFLEAHPELLGTGNTISISSHPVLRFSDDRRRVPDFILQREDGFCDLLEIKRPDEPIVVGPTHRRMLAIAVHRALAQLREYATFFESKAARDVFETNSGLKILRPNLMVLIGRARQFTSPNERLRLTSTLDKNILVKTYDDLVVSARQKCLFVERNLIKKIPTIVRTPSAIPLA